MKEEINIFNELIDHVLEGVMFHHDTANLMAFLGCKEKMKEHREHEDNELCNLRCLEKYCITHLDCLPKSEGIKRYEEVIPASWIGASRFDVSNNDRKGKVKDVYQKWRKWETGTKEFFSKKYEELIKLGAVASAEKISKFICDVDHELKKLEQEYLKLSANDWEIL